jgi:hypothetical protein
LALAKCLEMVHKYTHVGGVFTDRGHLIYSRYCSIKINAYGVIILLITIVVFWLSRKKLLFFRKICCTAVCAVLYCPSEPKQGKLEVSWLAATAFTSRWASTDFRRKKYFRNFSNKFWNHFERVHLVHDIEL